ncbi:hypothetical protein BD410DRAFT_256154 [Rickenella mellea]|uniref:Protein BCP1 n=1 Tax=Rickenella mellea TaxID=50990 RepID=A0A4Y7Q4I3_9AGAM|nr:hypothetical protein BD410DRAFT_256154 [Rickenella mellea]
MSKRKQPKQGGTDVADDEGEGSDVSLIDVDFEFFDPNPTVDYQALKRLSIQLFQADAELFHLNELAELILSQPLVGTTVKTDGKESDPYAVLTVLNMHVHKDHPSIKALSAYAQSKSSAIPAFQATIQELLSPTGLESANHVGFVFSERLINMPVQVIPPMYRMLADEIQWALDDNEPYKFSHLLFLTRTYRLTAEEAAVLEASNHNQRPSKRQKGRPPLQTGNTNSGADVSNGGTSTYSFHPEDEYIQKFASHSIDYNLSSAQPRDADAFGLDTAGRIMLVPADRLKDLVQTLSDTYAVPQ